MNQWFSPRRQGVMPDSAGKQKVLKALDDLILFATEPSNSAQLKKARESYFGRIGQVFEDDSDFDQRMNTFLEWMIFDYKSGGAETATLFEKFIDTKRDLLSNEKMIFIMTIAKHLHSLFQVKFCGEGWIKAKEIASGRVYWITGDDNLEKGDLLESRLVCIEKNNFFSYTYCLHPKAAYRPILAELKKTGLKAGFFLRLQAMQLKWRRSRRIKVRDIYRF